MFNIRHKYARSRSLRRAEERAEFLHLELQPPALGQCHWRGSRVQRKDRLLGTSLYRVYLDHCHVPRVFKSLALEESFLVKVIRLNLRLKPKICSFHLLLQRLTCRTCFLRTTLKAGVATEIEKLKLMWERDKLLCCCHVPHAWGDFCPIHRPLGVWLSHGRCCSEKLFPHYILG